MLGFEWPDLSLQWPASFVSLASRRRMRSVRQHTWLISGLSVGFTLSMLSMRSLSPWEYADCGCLYCAFNTAMAIEPPCSIVCVFSKGEWEYANAYNVQPRDWGRPKIRVQGSRIQSRRTQMSTFSSIIWPVFTSNSSGARYAIVLCSAAMSYSRHLRWRRRYGNKSTHLLQQGLRSILNVHPGEHRASKIH